MSPLCDADLRHVKLRHVEIIVALEKLIKAQRFLHSTHHSLVYYHVRIAEESRSRRP